MKILKRNKKGLSIHLFVALFCVWGISFQGIGIAEDKVLYDDFSGNYLDPDKWYVPKYLHEPPEKVIQVQDGKLHSFIRGKTDSGGMYLNGVYFPNPQNITSVATKISINEILKIKGNMNGSLGAQLYLRWYNSENGVVQVWLTFGFDWGSEKLSAFYDVRDGVFNEGGTLATDLNYNTAYDAKVEYIEANNQFIISAAGNTVIVNGPPKISEASEHTKFLLTGIWLPPGDVGSVSASFDDVYVNGALYDDFENGPLDKAKWSSYEIVRKIEDGKLNLYIHNTGQESIRFGNNNNLILKNIPKSVEANFIVKSDSFMLPGARGQAGIFGQIYNDTYGPGSGMVGYNGYEGSILAALYVNMRDDGTLYATYDLLRVNDKNFDTWTDLFKGTFETSIEFDTPVILGLYFDKDSGRFIFKCNNEQKIYNTSTPIYETNNPLRLLRSRVMVDSGLLPGYMVVDVDNVYINSSFHVNEIIDTVEDKLFSGEINEEQVTALLSTLKTAEKLLDDGKTKPACNLLGAFIKKVEAMMKSGRISEEDGQELINAAASAKEAYEAM